MKFHLFNLLSKFWACCQSKINLDRPIFIIGVQRSGTRLLERKLLNSDELVSWSEANHVWEPHYYHWYDLSTAKKNIPGFAGRGIHAHSIPAEVQPQIRERVRRLFGLYTQLYNRRLLHKNPFNTVRLSLLEKWFENPKIVHIVRDARGAINSFYQKNIKKMKEMGFNEEKVIKLGVYRWKKCLEYVRKFQNHNPHLIHEVRYSDLSGKDSDEIFEQIYKFCRIDPKDSPWRKGAKIENRNHKWKKELNPDLVKIIENNIYNPAPESYE